MKMLRILTVIKSKYYFKKGEIFREKVVIVFKEKKCIKVGCNKVEQQFQELILYIKIIVRPMIRLI